MPTPMWDVQQLFMNAYMAAIRPTGTLDDFVQFIEDWGYWIGTRNFREAFDWHGLPTAGLTRAIVNMHSRARTPAEQELALRKLQMFRTFIHSHGGDDAEMGIADDSADDSDEEDRAPPAPPAPPAADGENPSGGRKSNKKTRTK